jgi:hypothetical protein
MTMVVVSPNKLAMLCRALQEAYAEALLDSPGLSKADERDLKARLARLILDAYQQGETEPRLLKEIALARLALQQCLIRH